MKRGYTRKWVHPRKMITHFSKVFKDVDVKKTSLRNLLFVVLAVAAAKTFRSNGIAARLPILVKKEKSKQKRLLRFLETPLPLDALIEAWCLFACRWIWKRTQDYFYVLIGETDLPNGWKAIVASIPFRNRAIPIFWRVYENEEIRNMTYKSHNTLIQHFCLKVNELTLKVLGRKKQKPLFVFDRGFARAEYVIDFLKTQDIAFVMRICRNVGITHQHNTTKLDDMDTGGYANVLYHQKHRIRLNLYIYRNETFKEPITLASDTLEIGMAWTVTLNEDERLVQKIDNRQEYKNFVQQIQPKQKLTFTLKIDELLFREQEHRRLRFSDLQKNILQDFANACRSDTDTLMKDERSFFDYYHFTEIANLYDELIELNERLSKDAFMLQIGWGTGYHANTVPAIFTDDDESPDDLLTDLRNRFRLGESRSQRGDYDEREFPKTRRILYQGQNPIAPLGWIKISPLED